eukprot:6287016-Lingulodinium_polyedra.AAC.1
MAPGLGPAAPPQPHASGAVAAPLTQGKVAPSPAHREGGLTDGPDYSAAAVANRSPQPCVQH